MTLAVFYVPIDTISNAKKLAHELLNDKLISCANIFPAGISIYLWDGKIEESAEIIMILKAPKALSVKAKKAIKALHPYKIPCILELGVKSVNKEYLNWCRISDSN